MTVVKSVILYKSVFSSRQSNFFIFFFFILWLNFQPRESVKHTDFFFYLSLFFFLFLFPKQCSVCVRSVPTAPWSVEVWCGRHSNTLKYIKSNSLPPFRSLPPSLPPSPTHPPTLIHPNTHKQTKHN